MLGVIHAGLETREDEKVEYSLMLVSMRGNGDWSELCAYFRVQVEYRHCLVGI